MYVHLKSAGSISSLHLNLACRAQKGQSQLGEVQAALQAVAASAFAVWASWAGRCANIKISKYQKYPEFTYISLVDVFSSSAFTVRYASVSLHWRVCEETSEFIVARDTLILKCR